MDNTNEENDLKRCSNDGILLLKSNISKNKSTKDKVYLVVIFVQFTNKII